MVWSIAPVLGTKNVANAVEYYREKLGFQNANGIFRPEGHEADGVYAVMTRDEIDLHIQIRRRELYPDARERIESDVYLYVEDVDLLFTEFDERGAKIVRSITDGPNYGLRDFVIEDLDQNRLIFGSPITSE
ncbi:MAG: VOC family protein [Pseudomonadota bacterium]|nr:VOC family protein [Pseudomonadota bacterium]